MIIGVPKEIKDHEYRIAATPGGVCDLVDAGHRVLIETQAGMGSGFSNEEYQRAGGEIVQHAADAWAAQLVVKVKEPQPDEYRFLRSDLVLFTYLHLAAEEHLTRAMMQSGVIGIAYETVELADGKLPLLTPMSEVAGRLSIQVGAHYLEKMNGGRGKLLGGVPGVRPAEVVIIGGGIAGTNAAQMALGLGAHVLLIEVNLERIRYLNEVMHGHLTVLSSNALTIADSVQHADLVVGTVLVKGARAPCLVTREMVKTMPAGSVIVDVAVDQGGCVETTRPTTHSAPIFIEEEVIHYCVTNMPGAVPSTSTQALSNATLPYIHKLVSMGVSQSLQTDTALAKGVNTYGGAITYPAVAETFGLAYTPLEDMIP